MSTGTGADTSSDLRSDADLILAARSGDSGAFGLLYERHAGAALVVARQYCSGTATAEDAVADAFTAVWSALRGGSGPTDAFRAYLFTVVRRVAAVHRTKGRRDEPTDDLDLLESASIAEPAAEEPALAGFERSLVARAFASLPERWQAVLWHSEVEGKAPAEIAPLLGLTPNGTAALAYRAREGLRQAYLQQHLSDDLPDACRAVAGQLGAYVRGGLGARDLAQVEAHLDGCGRCRPLVLELRDVNHGLRSVIAPLVLGIAGLEALKFALPTSGGLAAGTASLASGGVVAGSGGAAAAGGAGAAGTAGGAGAAGVGVAAGAAGASGGAATGGLIGAIGGFVASLPTALVAGIAGVLVVAGVTVGVVALNAGHGGPSAGADGTVSSSDPTTSGPSPSSSVLGEPTADAGAAGTDSATGSGAPSGSPSGGVVGADLSGTATVPSDTSTGSVPATTSTSAPSVSPTPTPPPAGTASLVVSDPVNGLSLVAGTTGQQLAVDVSNAGTAPATDLFAQVDLPAGVTPELVAQVAGRFAVHLAPTGWSCTATATGVGCSLPVLGAGQATHLALLVGVDEAFPATSGTVVWRVSAAGLPVAASLPVTFAVKPAPPRLTFAASPVAPLLLRGHPATVQVPLWNAGGLPATPATVTVAVPQGLTVTGAAEGAWTCSGTGVVTCTIPSLGPRTGSTLTLQVVAAKDATAEDAAAEGPAYGSLGLTLAPAGAAADSTGTIAYQVVTPARLSATPSPDSLSMRPGTQVATTITVANTGDLDATDVTAVLTRPAGATWSTLTGQAGWSCAARTPDQATVSCTLAALAAGATSSFTVKLDPVTPMLVEPGALVVTLHAGPDVDVAGPLSVPLVGTDLDLRYRGTGALDVTEVGAPLLGCRQDAKSHCWNQDKANDNDFDMEPVDLVPAPGELSPVSSSTTLTLPQGVKASDVTFAGLYWSANKAPGDGWTADLDKAQLQGPGGTYAAVTGSSMPPVQDSSGRTYYQSFADVTAAVQQLGGGTWSFADAAVAKGRTDTVPTYYAGWSLVVVYRTATVAPTTTVSVYDGAAWVASNSSRGVGIATGKGATVKIGVVAWDGDRNTTGDCLSLDSTALSPGCGDRPTSQANAFDSTATGWPYVNSLGVDAKSFDPVLAKGVTSALTASTTSDQYLLGVLTTRVTP